MITTPTSFTYDYLSSLKFKELQKLSVQYHVNKRWAKKQELIDNLLALVGKDKAISENKEEDENEWRDGSTIFNDLNLDHDSDLNRRFTFNITAKASAEAKTPQAPHELGQSEDGLLRETTNSRETYDIPPSKIDLNVEALAESRATFDIPPKPNLIVVMDPRATFDIPQNGKKLLEESAFDEENPNFKNVTHSQIEKKDVSESYFKEKLGKIKFDINVRDDNHMKGEKIKSHVKMLTIPYARVTRRTRKDGEASKSDSSPIKMSKKSINIKKSTRPTVSDLAKSPAFSSVKKSINKQPIVESLTKSKCGKNVQNKVPVKLQFKENHKVDAINENSKKIVCKGMSKTSDEVFEKKQSSVKVNFRPLSSSVTKSTNVMPLKKTPLLKDTNGRMISSAAQTPAGKHTLAKPITATKMPDFSKIHKKQFEQMDSLHDYIKKKQERIRKLFGTPQPGQQLQVHNKSTPLFQFRSGAAEKDDTEKKENLRNVATPLKRKEHDSKGAQKEAFKSKLPRSKLQSDIKDKNRSHIHGVRTNKRFELQMKLRNM